MPDTEINDKKQSFPIKQFFFQVRGPPPRTLRLLRDRPPLPPVHDGRLRRQEGPHDGPPRRLPRPLLEDRAEAGWAGGKGVLQGGLICRVQVIAQPAFFANKLGFN